jgi:hypothetical protein
MRFMSNPTIRPVAVSGNSSSSSGAFDTSAKLDTGAARIRNATVPVQTVSKDWSFEHSGTPPVLRPDVTDWPSIE